MLLVKKSVFKCVASAVHVLVWSVQRPMNTQLLTVKVFATLQRESWSVGLQGGLLCLVVEEPNGGSAAEGHHIKRKVIMCSVEVKTQSGLL